MKQLVAHSRTELDLRLGGGGGARWLITTRSLFSVAVIRHPDLKQLREENIHDLF